MFKRRDILTRVGEGAAITATVGLAGCSGGNGDPTETGNGDDTDNTDSGGSSEETTRTDSGGDGEDTNSTDSEGNVEPELTDPEDDVPGMPDIQFEAELTSGEEGHFGGATGDGCGVLRIYTAGGTDSVGTMRLKIVGSSLYPDGKLWATSGYYNLNQEVSPETRADSVNMRVDSGDEIRIHWITDDDEELTLENLGRVNC